MPMMNWNYALRSDNLAWHVESVRSEMGDSSALNDGVRVSIYEHSNPTSFRVSSSFISPPIDGAESVSSMSVQQLLSQTVLQHAQEPRLARVMRAYLAVEGNVVATLYLGDSGGNGAIRMGDRVKDCFARSHDASVRKLRLAAEALSDIKLPPGSGPYFNPTLWEEFEVEGYLALMKASRASEESDTNLTQRSFGLCLRDTWLRLADRFLDGFKSGTAGVGWGAKERNALQKFVKTAEAVPVDIWAGTIAGSITKPVRKPIKERVSPVVRQMDHSPRGG